MWFFQSTFVVSSSVESFPNGVIAWTLVVPKPLPEPGE